MGKKIKAALSLVIASTTLLAACSTDNKAKTEGSKAPDGPVSFTIALGANKNKVAMNSGDINNEKYILELGKLTNTKLTLKVLQDESYREAMGVMFASGDIPDVIHVQQGMLPLDPSMGGAVEAGVFKPLNDLLAKHGPNLMKLIPKDAWDEVSIDGKIYAIPQYLSNPSRRAMVVRTDLLEKYDINKPKTVEDFMQMLRTLKAKGHSVPFGARTDFAYSQAIFGAYDVMFGNNMFEKQGDQIVPKFMDVENMTKALTVWKTMQDEGLVAPDWASHGAAERGKNIDSGKTAVWEINANSVLSDEERLKKIIPEAKLDVIASPVGPDGKGGNMLYSKTLRLSYLSAKLDDAKAGKIIEFFDWMLTEKGKEFLTFGIEGQTYTKDASGKIEYKEPKTEEEINQQSFLSGWVKLVGDMSYDETLLKTKANGQKVLDAMAIVNKEGREGISFIKPLEAYSVDPDITPGFDKAPKVIGDALIQMIYGKRPISDYPKVLEEWKKKGGDKVIKEATESWNKKKNIFRVGPDANVK
ncbi:extracellular solute-binding protein [Paenibacillus silviterrae]|uniref:extracellular solute-binding protein n=1 Tax=Paenibacillus silviterrae TaxID=3242194 RepID=UPI002542710F|nr:extracellular solute-binding protein [Paenibacillus chinjuensis]